MKKSIILFLTVSLLSIAISAVIISFSEKITRNTDDGNDRKENVEKSVTEEDAMSMMERKITDRVRARERKIRNMMLAVIALTVVVSSIIIDKTGTERRRTEIRNKRLMRSIELLEKEKEMLSSMRKDGELNEEMRGMLEERLRVLNGFITAYVSGNCSEQAYNELENLMSDRKDFIHSTRLSFAIGHPRFLEFLKEKGLTDMEIGYCCLHAIGLRGKEIVSYLNSKTYYNASSAIRKKLGLNEHDTNINLYIQKLIKEIGS